MVSIPRLDEEGCEIKIKNGKLTIKRNDKIIMEGIKENGLYMIDMEETENILLADNAARDKKELLQRIHSRLGHRNLLQVKKYIKNNLVKIKNFPLNTTDADIKALPLCDVCQRSKFTSMRRRGRGSRTAEKPGQKLVTDMKGPIRVKGLSGQRYYQGFQDLHTKFLYHKHFERKSAAPENLLEILEKPLFKINLENYHSDGAPELLSKTIICMLRTRGVTNTFSPPYQHSDNGQIERTHRTIFEMAHAMLLFASLSTTFWCEAVDHAVYLFNRLPTQTGAGYMAPITAAFGVDADLTHEAIFGCTCYVKIPEETREKGFVEKASKCIYLGHRATEHPATLCSTRN